MERSPGVWQGSGRGRLLLLAVPEHRSSPGMLRIMLSKTTFGDTCRIMRTGRHRRQCHCRPVGSDGDDRASGVRYFGGFAGT